MIKPQLTISTLALSAALLTVAPLKTNASEKVFIDVKPRSGWAATMIEAPTPEDSYCALTREYDHGFVFTLGQNTRDEYSLAFDFQNEKLNPEKAYKINLQPGPGQLRAYEMMPASAQALVIRLGYDKSFLQAMKKSSHLKAEIDGKNYKFAMDQLGKGKVELKNCMAGLTGENVIKTADKFSAEKVEDADPLQEPIQLTKNEITPENPIEVKKPIDIPAPEKVSAKKIAEEKKEEVVVPEAIKTPEPIIIKADEAKPADVKMVKADELRPADVKIVKTDEPKKAIQISRIDSQESTPVATPKPEMPAVEAPKVEEAKVAIKAPEVVPEPAVVKAVPKKEKITEADIPKMEDKKLASNTRVSVAPDLDVSARPKAMAGQDKDYGSKATPQKSPDTKMAMTKPQAEPMPKVTKQDEVKKLVEPAPKVAKKDEPKKPAKPVENVVPAKEVKEAAKEVKIEKPKVEKAKAEIEKKVEKPVEKNVKPVPRSPKADVAQKDTEEQQKNVVEARPTQTDKELETARKKLKELEKENHNLYREAREARGQVDTAVVKTSNEALKKMRAYENKLAAAQADNLALSREVEELRRVQEDTQVSALTGDPNAQRSLTRYNEAEREIKRLGLLLEQQRFAHRQEKTELEEMLFDPAVTDQAQRRKLSDLELKLAAAEKQLQVESQKVNRVDPQVQQRLQEMERKLAESKQKEVQLKVEQQALQEEQQKVKLESQKVAAAEAKFSALAQKEQTLKSKEHNLKSKEQKMRVGSQKMAEAEAKLAEARRKEGELAAAAVALENKRRAMADLEAKLAETRRKEQALAAAEQALRAKEQAVKSAEAKLVQTNKKEQELLAAEQALKIKTSQAMASANAKLAETRKKEQEIKAAEKRIAEQSKKMAAYSKKRVSPKEPVAAAPLNPSAKNIRSNPPVAKIPVAPPRPSFGQGNIQQLLNQSGLSSVSPVKQHSIGNYSWNAAGMTGKAQVSNARQNLSQFVQNYIAKEKQGCKGDFASLPATVPNGKQGFEIACVGPNGGKSSSVVFAQKNGNLIAIIHETTADNMDAAIDARDKVAARL